jgi:hypothetical protein
VIESGHGNIARSVEVVAASARRTTATVRAQTGIPRALVGLVDRSEGKGSQEQVARNASVCRSPRWQRAAGVTRADHPDHERRRKRRARAR